MPDLDLWKYSDVGKISTARGDENWTDIETEVNDLRVRATANESSITTLEGTALTLLSEAVASSSATIEFTDLDGTYDRYLFVFDSIVHQTGVGTSTLVMRTSSDNGATYESGAATYSYGGHTSGSNTAIFLSTSLGGYQFSGTGILFDPSNTTHNKVCKFELAAQGSSTMLYLQTAGQRVSTAAVNAVQFRFLTGTMVSGKITAYGVR